MNKLIFSCLFALAVAVPTHKLSKLDTLSTTFSAWKEMHNVEYETDAEHNRRFAIFAENAATVERHNSEGHSWTMGLNQFADLTAEEFVARNTLKANMNQTRANLHIVDDGANPSSVDWRQNDLVNPVKNQGQCGSCWAFSTVVSLEGQVAKKTGSLESFSEQDLVDCVKDVKLPGEDQSCCDGCQGGLMDYAFAYMISKQGGKDDTEDSYPYTGADGTCSFSSAHVGSVAITGYTDVAQGDESALEDACATVGPISVAVNANLFWQLYSGGILDPLFCSGSSLDHGVAVVGYGTEGSKDYWIVRNSWGETWGESGYVRLAKGKNKCGIANSASYPTL